MASTRQDPRAYKQIHFAFFIMLVISIIRIFIVLALMFIWFWPTVIDFLSLPLSKQAKFFFFRRHRWINLVKDKKNKIIRFWQIEPAMPFDDDFSEAAHFKYRQQSVQLVNRDQFD